MEPGELVTLTATFIKERNGRALVRLPNGSKTSVAFQVLGPLGVRAHVNDDGTGKSTNAWCSECDYVVESGDWQDTIEAVTAHWRFEHRDA